MFFDNWQALVRVVVVGTLSYVALIAWLRLSGKRSLAKWNAFDFVVTIAVGSTLATVLLSKDVAFAEGFVAMALLVGLQFAITWLSVRWPWLRGMVKAEPTLLLDRGVFLDAAMRQQRVTESEVRAAIRAAGLANVEDAFAVVLETDGSVSVVKMPASESASALLDVPRAPSGRSDA